MGAIAFYENSGAVDAQAGPPSVVEERGGGGIRLRFREVPGGWLPFMSEL